MSIRLQFLLPMFLTIIGGLGLAGHIGWQSLDGQAHVEKVVSSAMEARELSSQIVGQFQDASAVVDGVLEMTNFISAETVKKNFDIADEAAQATLAKFSATSLSPDVTAAATELSSRYEAWRKDARVVLGLDKSAEVPTQELLGRGQQSVRKQIELIDGLVSTAASEAVAQAGASLQASLRSELTYSAIGAVVGILVLLIITQRIVGPISRITRIMGELSGGEMNVKVPARRGAKEIKAMIDALAVFKDNAIAREELESSTRSQNSDLSALTSEAALLQLQMAEAVERATNGDFSGRITGPFSRRENLALASGLNALVESFEGGIDETSRVLSSLAAADLTVRFEGQHKGAFAKLQHDANSVTEHLSGVISRLSAACQSVSVASDEIQSGTQQLSNRFSTQAATVQQTNATTESVASTVSQNAKRAGETSSVVRQTSVIAGTGSEVMQGAQTAMGQITDSASKISDIIGVIEDIAFQTNLLALNAGVEAARAGESGKGFAVVATEVRALAQKTAQASNEVKALIQKSSVEVRQGADLVRQATEQFSHIVGSITSISALSNEIASDSTSQSENLHQLTAAMRSLDQLITDNMHLVSNLTHSSDETSREMRTLREIVSLFRLPDGEAEFRRVA